MSRAAPTRQPIALPARSPSITGNGGWGGNDLSPTRWFARSGKCEGAEATRRMAVNGCESSARFSLINWFPSDGGAAAGGVRGGATGRGGVIDFLPKPGGRLHRAAECGHRLTVSHAGRARGREDGDGGVGLIRGRFRVRERCALAFGHQRYRTTNKWHSWQDS